MTGEQEMPRPLMDSLGIVDHDIEGTLKNSVLYCGLYFCA